MRDLLTRGTEALSGSRNEEARSLLSEAYRLRRSYDVAAALGQAELELGKHRDAAEHLDFAIREFPPGESRKLLKQLQDAFANAKTHVATLHVSVNQPGCEVTLDGALIGSSPLPSDVFAEPGQRSIGARVGAGSGVERVLAVSPGKDYTVDLTLNAKAAPAPAAPEAPPEVVQVPPRDESSEVSPKTITLIGGGALTAVLLGVGIAERLRASDADDEASAVRKQISGNCDAGSPTGLCSELIDDLDRRNRANQLAIYGFVGAGIAGAATAAVWFLWEEPAKSQAGLRGRHSARAANRRESALPHFGVLLAPGNANVSFTTRF